MTEVALLSSGRADSWSSRLRMGWPLCIAVLLAGLAWMRGWTLSWLCDDAFASFRYADNWARGLGFVFNANERVEGITNPLWTMMLAVIGRAGFNIESAAITVGLGAHVVCVLLLTIAARANRFACAVSRPLLPIGAIVAVADTDLCTFASGGLETSLFSTSVLASFMVAWLPNNALVAGVCAGLFAAVSGMLRPDGVLFAAPLALAFWGCRRRGLAPYLLVCITLLAAFHGWRWHYYGSLIPNTYYAKSAFLSWWSQGVIYLGYFSLRHGALLAVAVTLSLVAFKRAWQSLSKARREPVDHRRGDLANPLIVAWAMILVYTICIVRVGGDFMYARLLVPVFPLLVLVFDLSVTSIWGARPVVHGAIGMLVAGATLAAPCPVDTDIVAHHGIVDERAYYQLGYAESVERTAAQLRNCISGFPAKVAIYGGELRLAYRARIPVAIEAHAGLTDAAIAHRPLASRQRIGHEKISRRKVPCIGAKGPFCHIPAICGSERSEWVHSRSARKLVRRRRAPATLGSCICRLCASAGRQPAGFSGLAGSMAGSNRHFAGRLGTSSSGRALLLRSQFGSAARCCF